MTRKFDIENIRRVGPISIGMTKAQVHEQLGDDCKSFRRTPEMEVPCDYYENEGVFVYYKSGGFVEAVEIASPSEARIDGRNLLSMKLPEAHRFLKSLDDDLVCETDGAISVAIGIAIYTSGDSNSTVESAIVFEDGYYD